MYARAHVCTHTQTQFVDSGTLTKYKVFIYHALSYRASSEQTAGLKVPGRVRRAGSSCGHACDSSSRADV